MAEMSNDPDGRDTENSQLTPEFWERLRKLRERVREVAASEFEHTEAAQRVIEELAHKQGLSHAPYFDWSLTTVDFEARFNDAFSTKPAGQSIEDFAHQFAAAWPQGMAALELFVDENDPLASPPYSKDGLWPA
jgi:hypothetical protein